MVCFAGVLLSGNGVANEYHDSKPQGAVLDHDKLGLMGIEREKLATELAAYVCNELGRGNAPDGVDPSKRIDLANRMLAVALQLHPRNRTALIANFKLMRGLPTEFAAADYEPNVLAEYLYTRSKLLLEQGGEANDRLAAYLLAFAVEIDPTNEDAIYDLEVRSIDGKGPDWATILPWMSAGKGPEMAFDASPETKETEMPAPAPGPAKPSDNKTVPPPAFGGWPLDDGKPGFGPVISD